MVERVYLEQMKMQYKMNLLEQHKELLRVSSELYEKTKEQQHKDFVDFFTGRIKEIKNDKRRHTKNNR